MTDRLLVTRYRWTPTHPALCLRPAIGEGPTTYLHLVDTIGFAVGARRCIGHRAGDHDVPCPGARGLPRGRQCEPCQRADTFRPCMTCDGTRCPPLHPAANQRCRGIHHLYLADFGDDRIKVGTTSDARRDARLHDQGPIAALRVARGPGPKIKQIERFASTHTELVEAFRKERKRVLLSSVRSPEHAEIRLLDALTDLRDSRPPHPELFGVPLRVPMPALAQRTRQRIHHQQTVPVQADTVLRGEVRGAIGSVVLLEQEQGQVLLELGDLVGRVIDPNPPADLPPPRMQLGLF